MSGTDGSSDRTDASGEREREQGTLTHTYADALGRGRAAVPEGATKLGVARRPPSGFRARVAENLPALGPPAELLDELEREKEDFQMRGLCEEGAHNAAWDAVAFDERYRSHLAESEPAREAMERVRERLADGEDVALVCVENTEKKRCHRTALAEALREA